VSLDQPLLCIFLIRFASGDDCHTWNVRAIATSATFAAWTGGVSTGYAFAFSAYPGAFALNFRLFTSMSLRAGGLVFDPAAKWSQSTSSTSKVCAPAVTARTQTLCDAKGGYGGQDGYE
jgi:hypothetical protein